MCFFIKFIKNGRKDSSDDDESIQKIVNAINSYLSIDSGEKKFNITRYEAKKALEKALIFEWDELCIKNKEYIMEHAFNDIVFYKPGKRFLMWLGSCCSCKCRKTCHKKNDHLSQESLLSANTII